MTDHLNAKISVDMDMTIDEIKELPYRIDGNAEVLEIRKQKDQTKIWLGIQNEDGTAYEVIELVGKTSRSLKLKTAWKLSAEEYSKVKNKATTSEYQLTQRNEPEPFDGHGRSDNTISQNSLDGNPPNKRKSSRNDIGYHAGDLDKADIMYAYMAIAEQAEEEGCCHEAGVLRDIAHEEDMHHHLLEQMVNGHEYGHVR